MTVPEHYSAPDSFNEVPIDRASLTELQPGDVITGLVADKDYDDLNQILAEQVLARQLIGGIDLSTTTLLARGLAPAIRPRNFIGKLIGQAVVVPTDMAALERRRGGQRGGGTTRPLNPEEVISVIVSGEMITSRQPKPIGITSRTATYLPRIHMRPEIMHDPVSRILGRGDTVRKAAILAEAQNIEAASNAQRIARFALRRTFRKA